MSRPLVLAILDGWGCRAETRGNAIAAARRPAWQEMLATSAWTELAASGEAVGLPKGIIGNSEVGHLNLGAGRIVPQGVVVINAEISSGELPQNATLRACLEHVRRTGGTLHFLGLLSDGCVHSTIAHLEALIGVTAGAGVRFAVHAFPDGRDVPPKSAEHYVERLEATLARHGRSGAIASVIGRVYAMDRDKRWERLQKAYDTLVSAQAPYAAASALEAVRTAYARGETDEFIEPTIVGAGAKIADGDACIFFNFRADRARELTLAFSRDGFAEFPVHRFRDFIFATMTRYDEDFPNPVLFGPRSQYDTFGDVISQSGLRQLRVAETEKYAHVTYFFNGGREEALPGEDRILVPSDRSVPTYDLAPRMRAREITDAALGDLAARRHDVIIMNYANADMLGHTGAWEPTIAAIEILDAELARLRDAVDAAGGVLAITADHGNAEDKIDAQGNPLTAHTTNPVPFVLVGAPPAATLAPGGKLGDVAPTLLSLLELPVPEAMTGTDLLAAPATVGT